MPPPLSPFALFGRLYDLPPAVRNRLLTLGIPRVLPIASGLRIGVTELDLAGLRAVTMMPPSRRGRNHVGSVYIGALLVQAEITMATLVIGLLRPPRCRVLVKKNEAEFHARALGTVRATFAPEGDDAAKLARCTALLEEPGEARAEAWTRVELRDVHSDDLVCTARFLVNVKVQARDRNG